MVANKSFGKRGRKRKEKMERERKGREGKGREGVVIQTENIMIRREKYGEEN